jgi:hypothetical protein
VAFGVTPADEAVPENTKDVSTLLAKYELEPSKVASR